jgi:hypothetical protein
MPSACVRRGDEVEALVEARTWTVPRVGALDQKSATSCLRNDWGGDCRHIITAQLICEPERFRASADALLRTKEGLVDIISRY